MIARQKEQARLLELADSPESEFVAVYGRRRVGKTYLVRTTFEGEFAFAHSGVANVSNRKQLQGFRMALRAQGFDACPALTDWLNAFEALKRQIETRRLYSSGIGLAETHDRAPIVTVFDRKDLEAKGYKDVTFAVRPCDAWGHKGKPLCA